MGEFGSGWGFPVDPPQVGFKGQSAEPSTWQALTLTLTLTLMESSSLRPKHPLSTPQ